MLSQRIATHVVEADYDRLPERTRAAAVRALLDGLGVMLGASGSEEAAPFVALAREQPMQAGGAAVLGRGFRTNAAMAALANGAMAHVLDFEDAFDAAPCHPNASLLPAALAVAQAHGPVTGEDLITAVAVGCDLVCRLALSLRQPMEAGGWYPPPILGAFGATAAAAKLLRLDARQMLDAFSLVLCQNSCPGEIKYSADSVLRAVREAFPAQAAITSALLARRGVRGFEQPFEGKAGFFRLFVDGHYDEAVILDRLGAHFWIDQLTFKRWPCCRGTHAYIEAVEMIRARESLDWRDISKAILFGGEIQAMLAEPVARKRRPETAIEAKFSLPFTVASAIVHGDVTLDSFTQAALGDAEILAMAERIEFREADGWGRARPAGGEIELHLRDGRIITERIELAQGHPDRPLSDETLRRKFLECAGRAHTSRPALTIEKMEEIGASLAAEKDVGAWLDRLV